MARAPTARSVAAGVIARVLDDDAFAAAALDVELDRAIQLEPRDRALATELVYGTLRLLPWLEERLDRHAKKGMKKQATLVRAHLDVAAYQLLVLSRVPSFAAVNEAVSAVRALRGPQIGGFANAVLRKVASESKPTEEELARAALSSMEPALREAIVGAIGEAEALALVGGSEPPPLGIRVERASDRDTWLERLSAARPEATFERGRLSPHAIRARGAGRVIELPGYDEGAWSPQEEGSQVIALALGAKETDVVLDACAGRGNKTGLLARISATVDAADLDPRKLEQLESERSRIGVGPRATHAVDWSRGVGNVKETYDRILVDAPCSGTGTVRRRPEILLRRRATDLPRIADLQRAILERVATLVKPGGRVIYAVCSVLREEAEDVIAHAPSFGLTPSPFDASLGFVDPEATSFRILPGAHGTDGYFVASFQRTR